MPLITIIVPVYNVEKYLSKCINSILNQTFPDFELILVDDGSPDNCGKICDDYAAKDKRIKVIHKENGGVSAARNEALKIISGKYLTFCDSDDYYLSDWLENLYNAMIDNNSDLVVANYIHTDEEGNIISKSERFPGLWDLNSKTQIDDYINGYILSGINGWSIWSSLFLSEIVTTNNIYFCESCGNYAEDLCFCLEYVLFAKRVCCIAHSGYIYIQHENSMMQKSRDTIKLNQLNEVSFQFGKRYIRLYNDKRMHSIFHYMILFTEYKKMLLSPKFGYKSLNYQIKQIHNRKWFNLQSFFLLFSLSLLKKHSINKVSEFFPMARYTIHRNSILFKLDNYFAHKKSKSEQ